MHNLKLFLLAATAALLAACSGSGDKTLYGDNPGAGGGGTTPTVATLTLLTSSPQMPSDGTADATITALVRDNNNNVMPDVSVVFTASSGSLAVDPASTTNANGVVTATLSTAGDQTNRTITITGLAGTVQSTVDVNVVGTTLTLNGPSSLPLGSDGTYNVVLTDAGGAGIGNTSVSLSSSLSNGVSQNPVITDAQGRASFVLSATNGGDDSLTADALGIQATKDVSVSTDAFTFSAPAADTEISLGANAVVTVNWTQGGAAVQNSPIDFSTTRGTVSAATVNTDANGDASITVSANNAGPAVITASNSNGTSIQLNVEFVATTPAVLELQADPFTVATNSQSTITAVVRDAAGNLVKNQTVNFVLTDVTGGSLSVAQALTTSQGRAQTFYTATGTTSAVNGVQITATVQSAPAATDTVYLTVAQRQVFISVGTGNEIDEPNTAQYTKEWIVQVTDAQGVGVSGANVQFSVHSERYWDGVRFFPLGGKSWATDALPPIGDLVAGHNAGCPDEDIDRDGVLDPGEDLNNNNRIEAGNIASAAAKDVGGGSLTTDANGFGIIEVSWPQEYAYWLEVTLEVRLTVQGTEFVRSTTFLLTGSANDFTNESVAPPGVNSPFGTDGVCATPPPPDGP